MARQNYRGYVISIGTYSGGKSPGWGAIAEVVRFNGVIDEGLKCKGECLKFEFSTHAKARISPGLEAKLKGEAENGIRALIDQHLEHHHKR